MQRWLPILVLTAAWVTVLVILFTPEIGDSHGYAHPQINAMDQGGDGLERHRSVFLSAWLFGSVLIVLFVSLLAWATVGQPAGDAVRSASLDFRLPAFVLGGLLFEAVFTILCLSYRASLAHPDQPTFWGPFPAATSVLLFGIWLFPSFFVILYVLFFQRWILPPANRRRFDELVAEAKRSKS